MEPIVALPRRRKLWPLVGVWVAVVACALAAGVWVQGERAARRQRQGERLAAAAVHLATQARGVDEPEAGAELLDGAQELLDAAGVGGRSRAGLLVDLASLLVRADPQTHLTRARELLEQAWETDGLPDALRARIARDRGAVELLAGEADAAQEWYGRAQDLAPSGSVERLEILRRSVREEEAPSGR